ncbi:hypothetical protein [Microbacterium sp. bgisy203]|uniref:hypothetical protein n=1 Tax=Microbacterium sp. bgisy203 TaxID=3413799 RepID=UPI003D713C4B
MKPVLVVHGEIVGTWAHSLAVGRHHLDPVAQPLPGADASTGAGFGAADEASVTAALARFAGFLRG